MGICTLKLEPMKPMKITTTFSLLSTVLSGLLLGQPVVADDVATPQPAVATACAHDPFYADRTLWPEDVAKSDHFKQKWPKARVLVWANPGEGAKDGWEAKHWLEDGKPAAQAVDGNTDIVFPEWPGNPYSVSITTGRKYQPAGFRNMTVGKGVTIIGHFSAAGNVWIKAGAGVQYMDSMVGGNNTFVRNDNKSDLRLVDHFFINKVPGSSVEMIGTFSSDDNWRVNSGTLIVAAGSTINAGNRSDPTVTEKGTLVLLSGSTFTRRSNCDWGDDLVLYGRLLAGLPDRPLTSDAFLSLGWKSKGVFFDRKETGGRLPGPGDFGMEVAKEAKIVVTSSDISKARLVINCSKRDNDWGQIEIISRNHPLHGEPMIAKLKELPRVTDMLIKGSVTWEGIYLNDVKAGGLNVTEIPDLAGKDAPTFGPDNKATASELFAIISPEPRRN